MVAAEEGQVGVDFRGGGVVVAGAEMHVGDDAVLAAVRFATGDQRDLGVGFECDETVNDLHTGAF